MIRNILSYALMERAKEALANIVFSDEDDFFKAHIGPRLTEWAIESTVGVDGSVATALERLATGSITGPCGPILAAYMEWSPALTPRRWTLSLHADLSSHPGGSIHRVASWEWPWDKLPDDVRSTMIRKSVQRGRVEFVTPARPAGEA